MYLRDALDVVVRRWILVAVGLGVTVLAVFHTLNTVGPSYQATSQVVLLMPGAATGTNPYVDFPQGLETTATTLAAVVTSTDARAAMADQGLTAAYDVSITPDAGPLMVITATAPSAEKALGTRDAVMAQMATDLNRMQADAGVPAAQTIAVQPTVVSTSAEVLPGSRVRALVAVAAAGLLLVLLLTLVVDRALLRRDQRGGAAGPGDGDDGSDRVQPILSRPGVRVPVGKRSPADAPDPGRPGRSLAG